MSGEALPRCASSIVWKKSFAAAVSFAGLKEPTRRLLAVILLGLLFCANAFADSEAETYKKRCAACHGAKGAGDTLLGKSLKLRPLGAADVQEQSDNELFTVISKGKGKMPPYNDKLSRDQIHELVRYIRSMKP